MRRCPHRSCVGQITVDGVCTREPAAHTPIAWNALILYRAGAPATNDDDTPRSDAVLVANLNRMIRDLTETRDRIQHRMENPK